MSRPRHWHRMAGEGQPCAQRGPDVHVSLPGSWCEPELEAPARAHLVSQALLPQPCSPALLPLPSCLDQLWGDGWEGPSR